MNPDSINEKNIGIIETAEAILTAVPDPAGRQIVVLSTNGTMENTDRSLIIRFYQISGSFQGRLLVEQQTTWQGVPGLPEISWGPDAKSVFLKREQDVLQIDFDGIKAAERFPACFIPTDFAGEQSYEQLQLFRSIQAAGPPMLEQRISPDQSYDFKRLRSISDLQAIGQNCN
ncbi:MAG: hypothetical protein KDK39_15345 [Leptospiraceae bacterium]|nr:hypothetical protein [Leptospiraceae bacterium]